MHEVRLVVHELQQLVVRAEHMYMTTAHADMYSMYICTPIITIHTLHTGSQVCMYVDTLFLCCLP